MSDLSKMINLKLLFRATIAYAVLCLIDLGLALDIIGFKDPCDRQEWLRLPNRWRWDLAKDLYRDELERVQR